MAQLIEVIRGNGSALLQHVLKELFLFLEVRLGDPLSADFLSEIAATSSFEGFVPLTQHRNHDLSRILFPTVFDKVLAEVAMRQVRAHWVKLESQSNCLLLAVVHPEEAREALEIEEALLCHLFSLLCSSRLHSLAGPAGEGENYAALLTFVEVLDESVKAASIIELAQSRLRLIQVEEL